MSTVLVEVLLHVSDSRSMESSELQIGDLIDELTPDPWRAECPFSEDLRQCNAVLFDPKTTRKQKIDALLNWLSEHQPCLFGRMEAKQGRLAFCLLIENDLERGADHIRAAIEEARTDWRRRAASGTSHGFIIAAISERIALARPSKTLFQLASRLCKSYLGDGNADRILLDDVLLEIPTGDSIEWRTWKVGANYFSSQADGRWWQDHRIPGGMAFSMNSVGHMARTQAEAALNRNPALASNGLPREKLVYWALPKAMRTIGVPVEGSQRGAWLACRGTFPEDQEPPTYEQRQRYFGDLAGFSENRYWGLYHTDHTLPSAYFDESLWRKEDLSERSDLAFTYLHSLADEAYLSMGLGTSSDIGSEI